MSEDDLIPRQHDRDMVTALAKGLAIIEIFDEQRRSLTISEAAVLTNMTRAAARRYLLSLVQLGYMVHDGKRFSLTPRVMRLGHGYLALTPLAKLLQYAVAEIGRETGESITAAVLQENEALVVAHQDPLRLGSMTMVITVGTRLPLYSTAIGRVFLAFGPQDWAGNYLASVKIIRRTPKSLATRTEIENAVEEVRQQGYALIDEGMEMGLRTLAIPVRNSSGQMRAAIAISEHTGACSARQFVKSMLPILLKVQTSLSDI